MHDIFFSYFLLLKLFCIYDVIWSAFPMAIETIRKVVLSK